MSLIISRRLHTPTLIDLVDRRGTERGFFIEVVYRDSDQKIELPYLKIWRYYYPQSHMEQSPTDSHYSVVKIVNKPPISLVNITIHSITTGFWASL